jgi:ABC-type multidrug transport system ATPase subunit
VLSLKNCNISWTTDAEAPLIKNANVCLTPGQVVVLLGRNGAGKTCLLQTLAGIINPAGRPCVHRAATVEAAYLPQPVALVEHLTGEEFAEILGVERTPELKMQIAYNKRLGEVSSGEAQKFFMAVTMLRKAMAYLLDEPFTNLDQVETASLVKQILRPREEKPIFVISLHEPSHLLFLKDAVTLVIDDQRLLTYPNVEALFADDRIKNRLFPGLEWVQLPLGPALQHRG